LDLHYFQGSAFADFFRNPRLTRDINQTTSRKPINWSLNFQSSPVVPSPILPHERIFRTPWKFKADLGKIAERVDITPRAIKMVCLRIARVEYPIEEVCDGRLWRGIQMDVLDDCGESDEETEKAPRNSYRPFKYVQCPETKQTGQ
jgi:hypothetical protein